jgi:hypothetical protein
VDVETVFAGAATGYKLKKTAQADKTADADAASAVGGVGGAAGRGVGGGVERLLEEVKGEFSSLPVYVGVEDGYIYVKKTAPMDQRQFSKSRCAGGLVLGLTGGRRGGLSRWRR